MICLPCPSSLPSTLAAPASSFPLSSGRAPTLSKKSSQRSPRLFLCQPRAGKLLVASSPQCSPTRLVLLTVDIRYDWENLRPLYTTVPALLMTYRNYGLRNRQ